MDIIIKVFSFIGNLPGMVLVPIVIFLMAVCFRVKLSVAIKSSIMVGAGILGITVLSNMMIEYMTPLGNGLVENAHLQNDVLDLGIAPVFTSAMSLPFFVFLYPIGLLVNFLMLSFRWTKTVNVDFLNLFAILLPVLPIWMLTGNAVITLIGAVLVYVFCLKISDWTAPMLQKYYDVEGISVPHGDASMQSLYCIIINAVIDKIPFVNKIDFSLKDFKQKAGLLGETAFLSFLVGSVLGIVAGLGVTQALSIGIALACVVYAFPKVVGIIMEGLNPVSEKMRDVMQTRFHIEGANVGMDSAIFAGYPEAITLGAICMPIILLLYFILPGVRVIPSGESLNMAGVVAMILPFAGAAGKKGNFFRTILICAVYMTILLYGATLMSPMVTDFAAGAGFDIPEGTLVTSKVLGNPLTVIIYYITSLFTG